MGMAIADRKAEHLRIAGAAGVEHHIPTGLNDVRLRHRALPERRLADVRLDAEVLGRPLAAPLLISAMTGGTPDAKEVNGALVAPSARPSPTGGCRRATRSPRPRRRRRACRASRLADCATAWTARSAWRSAPSRAGS